jgi:hypothetical protein
VRSLEPTALRKHIQTPQPRGKNLAHELRAKSLERELRETRERREKNTLQAL